MTLNSVNYLINFSPILALKLQVPFNIPHKERFLSNKEIAINCFKLLKYKQFGVIYLEYSFEKLEFFMPFHYGNFVLIFALLCNADILQLCKNY